MLLASAVLVLVIAGDFRGNAGAGSSGGMMQRRDATEPAASTPVATTPEPEDPLDGDPLDGDPGTDEEGDGQPASMDRDAPGNVPQLGIERSGRPSREPPSLPSYDDDPATAWQPDSAAEQSWVWFDLGAEQSVREVRWLAAGPGAVEVAVSSDRRRWQTVQRMDVDDGWQGAALRREARYVRLTLLADGDEAPPAVAEVEIYGRERSGSVALQQEADTDREGRRDRANRDDEPDTRREDAAAEDASSETGGDRGTRRGGGRVQVSAEPGETRCDGDRGRCRALQGEVSVEEDCAADGSCTIDVRADGGTAVCDATGGDDSRAGRGEGRRGSDGGECEAVANGGAVAIGDINP